ALVVLTGRHSQQQIACLPVVPIGKLAQKRNVVVCHLSVRPRRRVTSADCGGPEECASDLHSLRICSISERELRNGSSKSERAPTNAHSTNCGNGHLIRVFRDIGRIFSLLFLLSHPSPIVHPTRGIGFARTLAVSFTPIWSTCSDVIGFTVCGCGRRAPGGHDTSGAPSGFCATSRSPRPATSCRSRTTNS